MGSLPTLAVVSLVIANVLTLGYALPATQSTTPSKASQVSSRIKAPAAAAATTTEPCFMASTAVAEFASAHPSVFAAAIQADIAYACLETVPNIKQPALDLLDAFPPYIDFQSTFSYLKNPPPGYLWPALDFQGEFAKIVSNVKAGAYKSEYDFQAALTNLFLSTKDGHFVWSGDATNVFEFRRAFSLVSISEDGLQLPKVFSRDDFISLNSAGDKFVPLSPSFKPSAIVSIDGIDVVTFLEAQSLVRSNQDPDALYNQVFFQLAFAALNPGEFGTIFGPFFYPGPNTTITFENRTTRTYPNIALTTHDFDGVENGPELYSSFLVPTSTSSAVVSSSVPTGTATSTPAPAPTTSFYPLPVIKHSLDLVAGYYLNTTGFQEVAVLAIYSFNTDTRHAIIEFQNVVQKFLAKAAADKKTKLIIDLQGNPGGVISLGTDTFAQLFPSIKIVDSSNARADTATNIFGSAISDLVGQDGSNVSAEVSDAGGFWFNFRGDLRPDFSNFPSWPSVFGPVSLHGDNFTNAFQPNISDPVVLGGGGIEITGFGNRTKLGQTHFAASDMILLYDGNCASTCTVFSEHMKMLAGVESIVVGGRPKNGPTQGVGGVKGSQVIKWPNLSRFWDAIAQETTLSSATDALIKATNFSISPLPIDRAGGASGSSNMRNHLRIGDSSMTPLQFVYEAADCRIWYTAEMLSDPNPLWNRVAGIAFHGTRFSSPYCTPGSTNHPTSLSGGINDSPNVLGPQNPPPGAPFLGGESLLRWVAQGLPLI